MNCMSGIPTLAFVLVVALINVIGGMFPGKMTGNVQLAFWLSSLLVGLVVYWALDQ